MTARVASINVSGGGVPKRPVPSAHISFSGVEGDRQRNLTIHGGPERAVSLFSLQRIEALQDEGHPIEPGCAGENLTIDGLDWSTIVPGTRMTAGEVVLEIVSYAGPCSNLKPYFIDGRFDRISQKLHPGWSRIYARVLREGTITEGNPVEILTAKS